MPIIFALVLHDLFFFSPALILVALVIVFIPGLLIAAWGVRVSRRMGGKELTTQAWIAAVVLCITAAILRDADARIVVLAVAAGLIGAALVIRRVAPPMEASERQKAWQRFAEGDPSVVREALIGAAAFSVATVAAYAMILAVAIRFF